MLHQTFCTLRLRFSQTNIVGTWLMRMSAVTVIVQLGARLDITLDMGCGMRNLSEILPLYLVVRLFCLSVVVTGDKYCISGWV